MSGSIRQLIGNEGDYKKPRVCDDCGEEALEIEYSRGEVDYGEFKEKYRCTNCTKTGYVSGNAEEEPSSWHRKGDAIET